MLKSLLTSLLAALALLPLLLACRAQEPASVGPASPAAELTAVVPENLVTEVAAEPVTIQGRFLLQDGSPVQGVKLLLEGWGDRSKHVPTPAQERRWRDREAQSDAEGRFRLIFDPPPGYQLSLKASRSPFAETCWRWWPLRPGTYVDVGDVRLRPAGSIRGRLLDLNGATSPGPWTVEAVEVLKSDHGDRNESRHRIPVDPRTGEFRLENLPPGMVEVTARSPLAEDIKIAPVAVWEGKESVVDLVYPGPDTARRIVVYIASNRGPGDGELEPDSLVLLANGAARLPDSIDGSGLIRSFDDLEPGLYDLEIKHPRLLPWRRSGVKPGTWLNANLQGSAALQLALTDPEGRRIDDYQLTLRRTEPHRGFRDIELRGPHEPEPADGLYSGLVPMVEAAAPPDSLGWSPRPPTSIAGMGSSVDPRLDLLIVAPGYTKKTVPIQPLVAGETRGISVQLQPGARLQGTILGFERANIEVVLGEAPFGTISEWTLYPEGAIQNAGLVVHGKTRTNARGEFSFGEVHPSYFYLVARIHRDFHALHGPIDVGQGGTYEVQIVPPPHGAVEGRILAHPDELEQTWIEALEQERYRFRSEHAAFQEVRSNSDFPVECPPRARVAEDGTFRLFPLALATYTLHWRRSPYPLAGDSDLWRAEPRTSKVLGTVELTSPGTLSVEYDKTKEQPGRIDCEVRVDGQLQAGLMKLQAQSEEIAEVAQHRKASAFTDGRGVASLQPLSPGKWKVSLVAADALWRVWASGPLELQPAGELKLSFEVDLHGGEVQILNAQTGQPRAEEWLQWRHGSHLARIKTDGEGRIRVRLPAGSYAIGLNADWTPVEWTSAGPGTGVVRL